MKAKNIKMPTLRQKLIVEATKKIIVTKGIENLTIRAIAKALMLTEGALYRHFKSKNEILSLLIEEIEQTLLNTIKTSIAGVTNPSQKLENILLAHLSYAEQRKGVTFIVISSTLNMDAGKLRDKMRDVIEKYLSIVQGILKEGIKTGKFRKYIDADTASIAFFGLIQSSVTIWSLNDYKSTLKQKSLKSLFCLYKKGIEQ